MHAAVVAADHRHRVGRGCRATVVPVLAVVFAAIPLLGVTLSRVAEPMLAPELWTGVIFLCVLPSTVPTMRPWRRSCALKIMRWSAIAAAGLHIFIHPSLSVAE